METEDTQSENENQEINEDNQRNEKIKERRKRNRKKYKAKKKLNKSLENNKLESEKVVNQNMELLQIRVYNFGFVHDVNYLIDIISTNLKKGKIYTIEFDKHEGTNSYNGNVTFQLIWKMKETLRTM